MARSVRDPQLELRYRSKDGTWRGQHAGKRTGRPKSGLRASERHKTREPLNTRTPVHVVIRVTDEVGGLRKKRAFVAIREGLITILKRTDFRVVHLSIQATHVHLLVEADNAEALSRGMQGFQISAAKHLNAELVDPETGKRRRGTVFADRYHATQIRSPRAARNTLSYILNNWRKHREDRAAFTRKWRVDPFSSAVSLVDWRELAGQPWAWRQPRNADVLPVAPAETWLLRIGWKRHGAIGATEVPGRRPAQSASAALSSTRLG